MSEFRYSNPISAFASDLDFRLSLAVAAGAMRNAKRESPGGGMFRNRRKNANSELFVDCFFYVSWRSQQVQPLNVGIRFLSLVVSIL